MSLQTELETAVARVTSDSNIFYQIVHGSPTQEVTTDGGVVKTVAKSITDLEYQYQASDIINQSIAARDAAQNAQIAAEAARDIVNPDSFVSKAATAEQMLSGRLRTTGKAVIAQADHDPVVAVHDPDAQRAAGIMMLGDGRLGLVSVDGNGNYLQLLGALDFLGNLETVGNITSGGNSVYAQHYRFKSPGDVDGFIESNVDGHISIGTNGIERVRIDPNENSALQIFQQGLGWRQVFSSLAFAAAGGDEADLGVNDAQVRLQVDFVATSPVLFCMLSATISRSSGTANDFVLTAELFDLTVNTTVSTQVSIVSDPGTSTLAGNAHITNNLAHANLTVGHTYRVYLKMHKTILNGPWYPRYMKIYGLCA